MNEPTAKNGFTPLETARPKALPCSPKAEARSLTGFTLLELLIVIGILAVLSSFTILVLNPAELLRQARDSQRINDLGALNSALSLYATTVTSPTFGTTTFAYAFANYAFDAGNFAASTAAFGSNCGGIGRFSSTTTSTSRVVTGTGWLPVKFTDIPGGSPLSVLPLDPATGQNTSPSTSAGYRLVYWYAPSNASTTWELAAKMESTRYSKSGTNDVENTDGGTCGNWLEVGTSLDL